MGGMGTKEVVTFPLLLCVVGLIKLFFFLLFCSFLLPGTVGESDSGSDMEGYGGLQEDDDAEEGGERIFGLGELVEFWDGTCVRG